MNRRIMLYDILDLGKQLKTVGMLVMLDAILNRVIENRRRGKRTWIYVDEIYLFLPTNIVPIFFRNRGNAFVNTALWQQA